VNAIHVYVDVFPNAFGIPAGSDIVIAHAFSTTLITPGLIRGDSNDIDFTGVATTVGPVANNFIPCGGTPGGAVVTRTLAAINLPLINTGALATTAQGLSTTSKVSGETTATVSNLNLLNGLVTADSVKADAHALNNGGLNVFSDSGSTFVNLKVAGVSYAADTPPNTQVKVPGVGTIYLRRVIRGTNSIKVVMVDLIVDAAPNVYSLPLGAELTVATAVTRIRR
jgi:hypothetical protein